MRKLKWIAGTLLLLLLAAVLYYSLPQRDIVRIVGTDVKRMDIGRTAWFWAEPDSLSNARTTRDVRFVNATFEDGKPYVYRNEDTNWSYPPYLKFDSGSLTAASQALVSTEAAPIWVVVTHYGWRIELLTLFPNIVDIRRASGPDERLIPWFNIIFIASLIAMVLFVRRAMIRVRERHFDPVMDEVSDAVSMHANQSKERVGGIGARLKKWRDSWKPKSERR